MNTSSASTVEIIPIDNIHILNSRIRDRKKFSEITSNIASLGLKKPITVRKLSHANSKFKYDLVCGQGRLEAYLALGQTEIPAIIIDATKEDCFLMSLIENLARRHQTSLELVHEIKILEERGYTSTEIAAKIDMHVEYVKGILRLLNKGEEKLIDAVEKEKIPISVAVQIAVSTEKDVQSYLLEAYEDKSLRGKALITARKIIENRRLNGKSLYSPSKNDLTKKKDSNTIMKAYHQEAEKQKTLIKKAKICEMKLLFIVSSLKKLFLENNFATILHEEGLDTIPQNLLTILDLEDS
ncbi:ParB/RepB/Spo0J family partition protein [Solidesulfovibrio sp. C21]|uniref:ParB/RepB/Spo0J family partition protein n=1 Tax=Solidesulfovibrio sp. C21 TaxID=3398613 RepID=UPI0039FD9B81